MHHSEKPYEMNEAMRKLMRSAVDPDPRNRHERRAHDAKMRKESRAEGFGPTGDYPDGRITASDAGEIRFGVAADKGQVVLNFGTPVAWIASPPDIVRELAEALWRSADEADKWHSKS